MRADLPLSLFPHPQESVSSSGTPHKRDSFIYSTWLEDSVSTTSGGSSPGTRPQAASPAKPLWWPEGAGRGPEGRDHPHAPGGGCVMGLPLTEGTVGGPLSSLRWLRADGFWKGLGG